MSEIMRGVLRMPPELWGDDPLSVAQRHVRYVEAADTIDRLQAERNALRAALKEYGWHHEGCPQYTRYTHPKLWPACTCGFDAAIDAAREAVK